MKQNSLRTSPLMKRKIKKEEDKSGMFIEEVEKELIKDGNLRPLYEWYDTFDSANQIVLEEASIKYLNNFNMTLIEIMFVLSKGLYEVLEMRKVSARTEEEQMRE